MAEPTIADIHARLVSLCALIPGITTAQAWWPDTEIPFSAAQLPAIVVNPAPPMNNTVLSGQEYASSMDWIFDVLVAHFPGDTRLRDRTTWDAIRPFVRSVPDFFNRHRYLELNDAGLAVQITLPSLYSVGPPSTLDGAMYAACGFRMTTITLHSQY